MQSTKKSQVSPRRLSIQSEGLSESSSFSSQPPSLADQQSKNEESTICSSSIKVLTIVILFYIFLGLSINVFGDQGNDVINFDTAEDRQTGSDNILSCSANSFLLGDKVCDDVTNTPRCLYDGGDCCLPDINKGLCLECLCKMEVDQTKLLKDKETTMAFPHKLPEASWKMVKSVIQFTSVHRLDICSRLCLDQRPKTLEVNSWMLNDNRYGPIMKDFRFCVCTRVTYYCDIFFPRLNETDNQPHEGHIIYIMESAVDLSSHLCFGKALISGGGQKSKVINLAAKETSICKGIDKEFVSLAKQLPYEAVNFPTGGLLNDQMPLICGGHLAEDYDIVQSCYAIEIHDDFSLKTNMVIPRSHAASIVIDSRALFVTGGKTKDDAVWWLPKATDTTEFVYLDQPSMTGPKLPQKLFGHCFLRIDQNMGILISEATSWVYTIAKKSWSLDSDLINAESNPLCGVVIAPSSGMPLVVVAGKGHDGKVQLWDLESNRWSMGPKLVQRNAYTHVATSMATSLVLLGSPEMQNSVLTCPTSKIDCQWQLEVNASPNIVGHDHQLSGSAFNVPDAFFQCQGPEVYNVYRRGSASVQFIFKKGSQDEGISACVGQNMRMYEPKCHDDMLAVAKTMKNLGFASVWLGMKRVNYKLRADDVGHGNIWERRLQYDSDKTEVTFQRMARFQDDTSYDEIPGDLGVSLTSDGYWVYKEGSFLIRDWVVCERIEEDLGGKQCELAWINDGYCDGINQIDECLFDGKDCCLQEKTDCTYCWACLCHEDGKSHCSSCNPLWLGDKICDGINNNEECKYDNGDCCLGPEQKCHCNSLECMCHEQETSYCAECPIPYGFGDGVCQGANNVKECLFDGGDCCQSDNHCNCLEFNWRDCVCHETGNVTCNIYDCNPRLSHNENCDSLNNKEECGYDGGDCCDPGATGMCYCHSTYSCDTVCNENGVDYCQTVMSLISCSSLEFVNDTVCDPGNNNELCLYDGGDCCLGESQDCSSDCFSLLDTINPDCKCHLDDLSNNCKQETCLYEFMGDNFCDGLNNKASCSYDGYDCCSSNSYSCTFCTIGHDCSCHLHGYPRCQGFIPATCSMPSVYKDFDCDWENNIASCLFDGGDCCLTQLFGNGYCDPSNNNVFCNYDFGDCCSILTINDGVCDIDNNNEFCSYDGDDCCLENLTFFGQEEFCKYFPLDCQCKQEIKE